MHACALKPVCLPCGGPVQAGVLRYKRASEQELERSGLPYTILRPNRLTDGARRPT